MMKVYLWYLIRAHQQPKFHLIVTHIKGIFKVKSNQNLDLGHIFNRARYMYMYCKCMFQQWSVPYVFVLLYNLFVLLYHLFVLLYHLLMNTRFFGYF